MDDMVRGRDLGRIEQQAWPAIIRIIDERSNAQRVSFEVDVECRLKMVEAVETRYDDERHGQQKLGHDHRTDQSLCQ
jgi:hypothetical protein